MLNIESYRPPLLVGARRLLALAVIGGFVTAPAFGAGTPAGTAIDNTATVDFEINGSAASQSSNTVTLTVDERLDVAITVLSPQVLVAAGDAGRGLLFTVTNTGNGSEAFTLAIDSALAGDDFDPVPAVPAIYFDTDGSGDFSAGDTAYDPGNNDPVLAADASIDVLLVNDIPGGLANGDIGRSQLTATANTGSGSPGDQFSGAGDGGVDAVVGASGGSVADSGEYLVADVQISVLKSVTIADPFGGNEPLPGSTLTYSIAVEVTNGGTAANAVVNDPIPGNTSFVASSIQLNGGGLTDAADADAGEYDTSGTPAVVVRLGDLTQADGVQTVVFQVIID